MRLENVISMLPSHFQTKLENLDTLTIDEMCEFYIEFRNYYEEQVNKKMQLIQQLEKFKQKKEYELDELEYFTKLQKKAINQRIFGYALNELFKNVSIKLAQRFPNIKDEFIVNTGKYKIYITRIDTDDCRVNIIDAIEKIEK